MSSLRNALVIKPSTPMRQRHGLCRVFAKVRRGRPARGTAVVVARQIHQYRDRGSYPLEFPYALQIPYNRYALRRAIELAVLLAMAVAVLRTWFLEGFPAGCQVSGASMAETLLGRHRDVVCADCGHRFPCDANGDAAAWRAVCPNCGYAGNRVDDTAVVAGDRVLVDRSVFFLRPPRRWEVVALRRPGKADALYVKRVVGLPRESIQIRHGSVFANGQIVRKTLSQQRAVAILVHDAASTPRWNRCRRPAGKPSTGRLPGTPPAAASSMPPHPTRSRSIGWCIITGIGGRIGRTKWCPRR